MFLENKITLKELRPKLCAVNKRTFSRYKIKQMFKRLRVYRLISVKLENSKLVLERK